MPPATPGLHHVTAIAGGPRQNHEFYTETLGLALVKRTVNHDDPSAYHRYYGDSAGNPGSLLTFFSWRDGGPGRPGAGQPEAVAFRVPAGSLEWWLDRLQERSVAVDGPYERDTDRVLGLRDPDGLELELVARTGTGAGPVAGRIPEAYAISGLDGVSLRVHEAEPTADVLTELGFTDIGTIEGRQRFRAHDDVGGVVDLCPTPEAPRGRGGAGVVHHVAFRVQDQDALDAWRDALVERGLHVTDVVDRHYFESIYFRDPGGVLFELTTEGPGLTVDESADALGEKLCLPPWLEDRHEEILEHLPTLDRPRDTSTGYQDS
jgi:glyoxalase family protein